MKATLVRLLVTVSALGYTTEVTAQGTFTPLGDLPGGRFSSGADDISADGLVVVGGSSSEIGLQAFRWTPAGGMVGLGNSPGSSFSEATGVSADGSVVVGNSFGAFRWTAASGMVGLEGFIARGGVSDDGSVAVGYVPRLSPIQQEAVRWTAATGAVGMGFVPGSTFSEAKGVSADGSVIVGVSSGDTESQAFRWTAAGGMVGLGDLPGGIVLSAAESVSADGSVVVGIGNGAEAFRWTAAGGMVGLGAGNALDVSADGSTVVGIRYSATGDEAFYWTQSLGMFNLREHLISRGVSNLNGWVLRVATGISGDGLTIVGFGTNPSGNVEGWVARIPEPPSFALAGVVACIFYITRSFRRFRLPSA